MVLPRTRVTGVRAILVALCVVSLAGCVSSAGPAWDYGADTPDDLRDLADQVLVEVVEAVPDRRDCIGQVALQGARQLDDRATYSPEQRRITIRIPATAPQLEVSLVHELAHHLEFACPTTSDLRAAFMEAQSLPSDAPWFDGPTWEQTPSEQWATAIVVHVLGHPDRRARVVVSDRALELVAQWAGT